MSGTPARSFASRLFYLFLALLWGTGIHFLTVAPPRVGPSSFLWTYLRNGGHAFLFSVLALLLGLGFPGGGKRRSILWILASAFGFFEEWSQLSVPGRSASLFDAATDAAGAAFGAEIAAWVLAGNPLRESGIRIRRLILLALPCLLFPLADTFFG